MLLLIRMDIMSNSSYHFKISNAVKYLLKYFAHFHIRIFFFQFLTCKFKQILNTNPLSGTSVAVFSDGLCCLFTLFITFSFFFFLVREFLFFLIFFLFVFCSSSPTSPTPTPCFWQPIFCSLYL